MQRTRNEKGQFNYKYQGSKEFILNLMAEGKSTSEIVAATLREFEGISFRTVTWYIEKYSKKEKNGR